MDTHKLKRLFHTLKYIRPTQVVYQLKYRLFKKGESLKTIVHSSSFPINFQISGINTINQFKQPRHFRFLNKEVDFTTIDWNYSQNGKLWTYNLNYFEFLSQADITKVAGQELIFDFCSKSTTLKDAIEPYPTSLRGINWIKFLSLHRIDNSEINSQLYTDYMRLMNKLEYHLLGNHLFENGFSLLFGSYYFRDNRLYKKAVQIIRKEIKEEILSDGSHFELSPMYHQIILHRILDCYQLVISNNWKQSELQNELKSAAQEMLGWLKSMQFSNGDLPMVNDTTNGIAPSPEELFTYAECLEIMPCSIKLGASGYRKLVTQDMELMIDVGQISPSYQPGHSHADSLQILLHYMGNPIIVDTGISTYEKNERRQLERSTLSHNTVTLNGQNSSDVWSGFRVGRRAHVKLQEDGPTKILASHNGYRNQQVVHERKLEINKDGICISDTLHGAKQTDLQEGRLHFASDINVHIDGNKAFLNNQLVLLFDQGIKLRTETYELCIAFNKRVPSTRIVYQFNETTSFNIQKQDKL